MKKVSLLIFLFLFSLCIPAIITAQEGPAPAKEDLGPWWNKSSLTYETIPKQFLLHSEITYSFTNYNGNLEGHDHDGLFMIAMRKQRLSFYTVGELKSTKYKVYVGGSNVLVEKSMFDNAFRYDIFKNIYADAGYRWQRESERMILNRNSYYGGIGGYLDRFERYNVSLFLAYGVEDVQYNNKAIQGIFPNLTLDNTSDDVYYIIQNGTVYLGPRVEVLDRFIFRQRLDDAEYYDIAFKLMVNVFVTRTISLSYRYEMDHYNKVFPIARKTDEQNIYGLTFKFDIN